MSELALVLATREMPGRTDSVDPTPSGPSQVGAALRVDALGLVAVAEASGPTGVATGAVHMALDQLRAHLERNLDILQRMRRYPAEALRERIQELLQEGFTQASREVFAFGHRRSTAVTVDLDAVLLLPGEVALAHAGRGAVFLAHEGLLHRLTGSEEPSKPLPRSLDEDLADPPTQHPLATTPLGAMPAPPPVECLTVGLSAGDRVMVLGPSMVLGLTSRAARRALEVPGAGALLEELQAVATTPVERPRVLALAQLGDAAGDRQAVQRRLQILRSIELFRWCSDDELHALVGLARPRTWKKGELLLRQGRVNTTLFMLVEGRVGVNKDGQRIAETERGTVFGEMSMLDEPRASATVEALTDIEALTLDRDAFLQALKGDSSMAVKVLWSMLLRLSANLRRTSSQLASATGGVGVADPSEPPPATVAPEEPE